MLANIDRAGLYRVNYDMNNWRALQAQLLEDHNVSKISVQHYSTALPRLFLHRVSIGKAGLGE